MRAISSWGRLSADLHETISFDDLGRIRNLIGNSVFPGLAHGMGRSYGDCCLNPGGALWLVTKLDKFIAFDEKSGRLVCEAGVLLKDIQKLFIPRGWALPVTPGTQMVTVGGAIANDVHGKNHHKLGSFGNHVKSITVLRTDGELIDCGPDERSDWFAATVGGIGLTGVIIQADIQMIRVEGPWIDIETIPYGGLEEFFKISDRSENAWDYTVAWFDCTSNSKGRGIFLQGNPSNNRRDARESDFRLNFPIVPPISLINKFSLRFLNNAYFWLKKYKKGRRLSSLESFFYPLDKVHDWNKLYGPKGFFQYQSVVPHDSKKEIIDIMLKEISKSGDGSFLAVLKTFGDKKAVGMLSFPMPGVTLALDFPNYGDSTRKLLNRLDAIVCEAGGRVYLAKDARMSRAFFESTYRRLSEFAAYRDPNISSSLSRRLMGY